MLSLLFEMLLTKRTHSHDPEEEDGVAGQEEEDGYVVGQQLHLEVCRGEGAVPQRHVRHVVRRHVVRRQAPVLPAHPQVTPCLHTGHVHFGKRKGSFTHNETFSTKL